jgi:hypothetical protein
MELQKDTDYGKRNGEDATGTRSVASSSRMKNLRKQRRTRLTALRFNAAHSETCTSHGNYCEEYKRYRKAKPVFCYKCIDASEERHVRQR